MNINKILSTFILQSEKYKTNETNKALHNAYKTYIPDYYRDKKIGVGISSFGDTRFYPTYITFLDKRVSVKDGIYPVFLIYPKIKIAILAFGISVSTNPDLSWDWVKMKIEKPENISALYDKYKVDKKVKYGNSFVYKYYETSEFVDLFKDKNLSDYSVFEEDVNNFWKEKKLIFKKIWMR